MNLALKDGGVTLTVQVSISQSVIEYFKKARLFKQLET